MTLASIDRCGCRVLAAGQPQLPVYGHTAVMIGSGLLLVLTLGALVAVAIAWWRRR